MLLLLSEPVVYKLSDWMDLLHIEPFYMMFLLSGFLPAQEQMMQISMWLTGWSVSFLQQPKKLQSKCFFPRI